MVLGIVAAFAFTMTAGVAGATHNIPKDAKQVKGEFVKSFQQCTSANTITSNGFPACSGVIEEDPKCTFTTKGKGKYLAKYNAVGFDKLPATSDDGDLDVQVTLSGLSGCNAQVLVVTSTVRATADDCGGASCTVIDLPNFAISSCTVDSKGGCKIKTTVNASLPGTLINGKKASIEILDVSVFNGSDRLLRGGVLVK
jgi:hypothetical protein